MDEAGLGGTGIHAAQKRLLAIDRYWPSLYVAERLVALPSTAPGKPVVVGIWDSGTDVAMFAANCRGLHVPAIPPLAR